MPSIVNPEMPFALRQNTIIKHMDNPFSAAALAEPHKDFIDLGIFDTSSIPNRTSHNYFIKNSEAPFAPEAVDDDFREAHVRFMEVASYLLTPEALLKAKVQFIYRASPLMPGRSLTGNNTIHLDGPYNAAFTDSNPRARWYTTENIPYRFMAFLATGLPTRGYQGPFTRSALNDPFGGMVIDPMSFTGQSLVAEDLPMNHMILVGPNLPHQELRAEHDIDIRRFAHWGLLL